MSKDLRTTDTIPRAGLSHILQVLARLAAVGGKSTFEEVRLFLVRRSERSAPSSRSAMYTVARDVLIELQKLELIQAGILPRTQSKLESHGDAPIELTETGRSLAELYKASSGRAFDRLLIDWMNQHPYFRTFIARLHQQPLHIPDITSSKQLGGDRSEESLDTLARRISENCLKRLSAVSFSAEKAEVFARTVGERVQELGKTALAGLDAKKWVDAIQDRVVTPALLTSEQLLFSDAVTLQYVLRAAKEFFAASWTTAHPEYSLRVVYTTCEFQPSVSEPHAAITGVVHHGKGFAAARFIDSFCSAYERVANPSGSYADAYAIRAIVCIDLHIQPKVFASCLADLIAAGPKPALTIYTELPFDSPPPGEDYIEIDTNRIGLLKLSSTHKGGQ